MSFANTFRTKETLCPNCHELIDAATIVHGEEPSKPKAGDLTVCAYCREILVYEDEGQLRALSPEDQRLLASESPEAFLQIMVVVGILEKFPPPVRPVPKTH